MQLTISPTQLAKAADEFDRHERRDDGAQITRALCYGLSMLRESFFDHIHDEVQRVFGTDSMIAPLSEDKAEARTKAEIELYQIAVSTGEVQRHAYVDDSTWYAGWLAGSRFAETAERQAIGQRIEAYLALDSDARRLEFERMLGKVMPESRKAPLVLYRLFPPAIGIVTAMAFGDTLNANEQRNRQTRILPSVADCDTCHGYILENGEACSVCGNPVWKYPWLTETS